MNSTFRLRRADFNIPEEFKAGPNPPGVPPLPDDAKIQHHLLRIVEQGKKIQFGVQTLPTPATGTKIREYAQEVARRKIHFLSPIFRSITGSPLKGIFKYFQPRVTHTPYDIALKGRYQRWIILELEEGYNWRFAPGSPGVATAVDNSGQPPSQDYGLCFVTKNSIVGPKNLSADPHLTVPAHGDPAKPEDWECKVLYWAVSSRPDENERKFNFYIEFHQVSEGKDRTLPMIFDPNVPNDGGGSIIP